MMQRERGAVEEEALIYSIAQRNPGEAFRYLASLKLSKQQSLRSETTAEPLNNAPFIVVIPSLNSSAGLFMFDE